MTATVHRLTFDAHHARALACQGERHDKWFHGPDAPQEAAAAALAQVGPSIPHIGLDASGEHRWARRDIKWHGGEVSDSGWREMEHGSGVVIHRSAEAAS